MGRVHEEGWDQEIGLQNTLADQRNLSLTGYRHSCSICISLDNMAGRAGKVMNESAYRCL